MREIALGHRSDHSRDFGRGLHQIDNQSIHRFDTIEPAAGRVAQECALRDLAFFTDCGSDALQFEREPLVHLYYFVEGVADLSFEPCLVIGHSDGKIPPPHRKEGI